MTVTHSPDSLYKILSIANWESSQYKESLVLDSDDDLFIHFSTENQLSRILTKYWQDRDYVVLKIDPKKLLGQLVFEANPGGFNKKIRKDGNRRFMAYDVLNIGNEL